MTDINKQLELQNFLSCNKSKESFVFVGAFLESVPGKSLKKENKNMENSTPTLTNSW